MRRSKQFISAAIVGAALLAGCAAGGSQEVTVFMTEGAWSVDPMAFEDVATLEFTFSNQGSETHQPIVVSTRLTIEELERHLEAQGTVDLVAGLVNPPGLAQLIYPGEESGKVGHFHPGDGDEDEPELPAHALVEVDDEGYTISYLFTETVAPGAEGSGLATAGKPGLRFVAGNVAGTFVVLCMNPDHALRGEYAVFWISDLQKEL